MAALQSPLILVERDIRNLIPDLARRVGYVATGRAVEDRLGLQVWAAMENLTATAGYPTNYCFYGYHRDWSLIGDESGLLASQPSLWQQVARSLQTRVILLFVDPESDAYGFRLFSTDGRSRAVLRVGTQIDRRGPACFAESGLAVEHLDSDMLLAFAQRCGVDVDELNRGGRFDVVEYVSPGVTWESHASEERQSWQSGRASLQPSL